MGDHTDYGIFTILLADAVPGLQIVGPDGAWHDVTPHDGNIVVNLGDALAIWTNDRWRSTLHRVVPPEHDGPALRRSFAFFHDGNVDTVIECLPSCTGPDRPARYAPTTIRQHLLDKVLSARTQTLATATQTTGGRLDRP
jgi:isopenicillin N synthase-like dioxygenase